MYDSNTTHYSTVPWSTANHKNKNYMVNELIVNNYFVLCTLAISHVYT